MQEVRTAADLLPIERFPSRLPERAPKRSRFWNIIHNRIFQLGMCILLAFALIAGGWVFGMVMGKKNAPAAVQIPIPTITTTPTIKTVAVTTTAVDVVATVTTTPTVWTTVFIAPSETKMGNSGD